MRFIWIDDSPDRQNIAENLERAFKSEGLEVEFLNINKKEVHPELLDLLKSDEPDLIIMDHSFDQTTSKVIRTGSTAAAILREKWERVPIVSVTGVNISDVDSRHRYAYEEMFGIAQLPENYSSIYSIAEGFKILKDHNPHDISTLLKLFDVPSNDEEKLKRIIPIEIKENFNDPTLFLEVYRWVSSILFSRPGFLFDKIWAATYIGLNTKGFDLVLDQLSEAKYTGAFANNDNPRWWKSELFEIVLRKSERLGLPWEIGPNLLPRKNKAYYSKCEVSSERYPETVAADDTTSTASWHPMKLKHTEPHPNFEEMLFFEELRIMKPAD